MANLIKNKPKEAKCFYCGTKPINVTSKKGLTACCCYCLQNDNGNFTQYYRCIEDKIKDEE